MTDAPIPKTLLIGLDGGTFTVLDLLAREGVIPNMARLMRDGARGILESTVPPISAPAWATFQTGKHPGGHGLFNFFDFSEGGFRQSHNFHKSRVVNHANIGCPTIYDHIREGGRKVISVNIPLTYPTPEVDGCIVSCWLTPPGSPEYTHPRSLAAEIPDYRIDQDFGEGMYAVTPRGKELDSDYLFDDLEDILRRRADATEYLIRNKPWDLCMVCFTETDRIHHYLWRAINPDYRGPDAAKLRHEQERFRAFYRELDARVGRLMEAAGPATNTFIVSDHGFDAPPTRRYNVAHWMWEEGWVVARPRENQGAGDGANPPRPGRSVGRGTVAEAARALWRAVVPRWVRERVYARLQYSTRTLEIDWARTRAWSFGVNNNLGAICINVQEGGEGCVPAAEVDALVAEIEQGLRALVDPATGAPVVREVMRRDDVFTGPYVSRFPHLLFLLDPDFEADMESGYALGADRITPGPIYPSGRGNHRPEGICIALGPDIAPGEKAAQSLASIMPTLLHLCGIPVPDDVDGTVMAEYLTPEARNRGGGPSSGHVEHRFAEPSTEDVERLQEKLRHLGYI